MYRYWQQKLSQASDAWSQSRLAMDEREAMRMGSHSIAAGQADQMLAEQRVECQDRALNIGTEEILPADTLQIRCGVHTHGPLILAEEAVRIVTLHHAELTAEANDGNAIHITHEFAVIAVEMIAFDGQIKQAQAFLLNLLGHIVNRPAEHITGVARHQKHHAVINQCFDAILQRR